MTRKECEHCQRYSCHGECENYIVDMLEHTVNREELERLFKEVPKFNYVREIKVNSIFGTDLEVATASDVDETKTDEFSQFLYKTNLNGKTNLHEIKKSIKEKETFGVGYLFFNNKDLYSLPSTEVFKAQVDDKDPVIDEVAYYLVGEASAESAVDENGVINFGTDGFIKQEKGYIISKDNMIVFNSDSYFLNSDLKQLQTLLEINRKICDSTSQRDFGDTYMFTSEPQKGVVSAVAQRVKRTASDTIKAMRERIAEMIKKGRTEDSKVVVLDESIKDVKQIVPLTKITDYQFIWEKQDDIIASSFNFPTILLGLGESSGNISKEALLKDARANMLTPLKADTANTLSVITKKMFGEEYYLRFKDYEEVQL